MTDPHSLQKRAPTSTSLPQQGQKVVSGSPAVSSGWESVGANGDGVSVFAGLAMPQYPQLVASGPFSLPQREQFHGIPSPIIPFARFAKYPGPAYTIIACGIIAGP